MKCDNCGLPMSLVDGDHVEVPYYVCDGPNSNTTEQGCGDCAAAECEADQ